MYRNRSFATLLTARTLSTLGDIIVPIAVPFAILDTMHGGSVDIGLVLAAELIGTFTFILLGGVFADRIFPVSAMIVADIASLAIQLATASLLAAGAMTIPLFAGLMFLKGIATGFFQPSSRSLLPRIVERDELQRASALLGTAMSVAMVVGPLIGGALVVGVGAPGAIAVDAVTFALSALLLARMRAVAAATTDEPESARPDRPRRSSNLVSEMRDGLGEVRRRKWLCGSIAAASVTALLGSGPLLTVMPVVAARSYGGATGFSWLISALAAGGILGGLAAARFRVGRPLLLAAIVLPALAVAPLALASSASFATTIVAFALAGMTQASTAALWSAAVSRGVPLEILGRVTAWDGFTALALRPLGQAVGGAMAGALGVGSVLWMSAAIFVVMPLPLLALADIRAPIARLEQAAA